MNEELPPRPRGPRVFLEYDQEELNAAYYQAAYEPNIEQMRKRWVSNSARTRARIGKPLRHAYGDVEIEKLDIFPTDKANAPIFVFLHGGSWRRGTASAYSARPRCSSALERALCRARFLLGAGSRRRSFADRRPDLLRDRLGPPQCREL